MFHELANFSLTPTPTPFRPPLLATSLLPVLLLPFQYYFLLPFPSSAFLHTYPSLTLIPKSPPPSLLYNLSLSPVCYFFHLHLYFFIGFFIPYRFHFYRHSFLQTSLYFLPFALCHFSLALLSLPSKLSPAFFALCSLTSPSDLPLSNPLIPLLSSSSLPLPIQLFTITSLLTISPVPLAP